MRISSIAAGRSIREMSTCRVSISYRFPAVTVDRAFLQLLHHNVAACAIAESNHLQKGQANAG